MENDNDIIERMKATESRPTMNDPKEFSIIRSVYMLQDNPFNEQEVTEQHDRAQRRRKNLTTNSR